MLAYNPPEERPFDTNYRRLLKRILNEGEAVMPQQGEKAIMILGHQMCFSLENGFPIITERDLVSAPEGRPSQFHQAIAELCAFLNGARTLAELRSFGCNWWDPWATPEKCAKRGLEPGDLGPGSYGPAWCNFPTAEGQPFDQVDHLVRQIRENPHLRTHLIHPWVPQYIWRVKGTEQKVVVVPCHGLVHVSVNPAKGELSVHHFQRSADVPVGLVFNLIQYAALTLMLAQITGYTAKELVYTISDAHIFESQLSDVREMLATKPRPLPSVWLDTSITDLRSFRPQHFRVSNYHPQLPRRRIKTPV